MELELERGCVYFFRHIGLSPVKIGYSSSESPIKRFEQFKTFAPYGSEILGFVIILNAYELEKDLHRKFANKRLSGEWFDITEDEVNKEVDFYTNISDIEQRNLFQIAWAKSIQEKSTPERFLKTKDFNSFKKEYLLNKSLNKSKIADEYNVSRQCIYVWINKINN